MKKEVEYTEEQAKKLFIDWNCTTIGIKTILRSDFDKFINHKFPPKIDYVGKVWKDEEYNKIFYCTSTSEYDDLFGYGFEGKKWFCRMDKKGAFCATNSPKKLTQATQEEWQAALIKEAERRYNVGDRIKDLVFSTMTTELRESNGFSATNRLLSMNGVLIMKDGKWAEPIKQEAPSQVIINGVEYIKKTES